MLLPSSIRKVVAIFRGEVSPVLILLSVLLGFWFGLTPGWYGIHVALLVLALVLNVHIGIFLLFAGFGKALCFAAAPLLYHAGQWAQGALSPLLNLLGALPVLGVTDFSRYAVAGAAVLGPVVGLVCGLLLALGSIVLVPALFRLLGTPDEVTAPGVAYLSIFMSACPILLVMIAIESIWRAAGDTVTPMWVMGGATLFNLALDPVLIFGLGPVPALGVEGAALASVISWAVSLLVFVILARRVGPRTFPFEARALLRPDFTVIRTTLSIGTPRFLVGSLFAGVYLFLSALTARLGTVALAVLGIVNRIESVVYLVSDGTGVATATLVGQNLGARQPDRAERATYVASATAIALSLGPSIAMLVIPAALIDIFTPDQAVVVAGINYLRIVGLSQVFMALEIVVAGAFAGAGDTKPPLLVEIPISSLRVPLAWLAAYPLGMGLEGVAWVLSITCIIRGIWIFGWFRGGRWKRRTWEGAA